MPDVIYNTSPIQYRHQLRQLHLLPALAGKIIIPPTVQDELIVGKAIGVDLPDLSALDWLTVRSPASAPALPLITDLGPGETEVLMLALEVEDSIVVLDDGLARRVAEMRGIRLTGTLGILLDAKKAKLIGAIAPLLDQLQSLRFSLSDETRAAVMKLAEEA